MEGLLERWPISGWCATYFNDVVKCHVIDNNICETFNGVMLEARSKPVITMLEEIRRYVMQRMVVKRNCVKKWKVDFGPNIIAKLEAERSKSGKWQVDWNGAAEHEVYWDDVLLLVRETYVVKLANNSCSCGKWDKSGISIPIFHKSMLVKRRILVHYQSIERQNALGNKSSSSIASTNTKKDAWLTSKEEKAGTTRRYKQKQDRAFSIRQDH